MTTYHEPFLLSDHGSDCGTAYRFSNKSVTLDGRTHVTWTDAVATTQARTFDHATGQWGPTVTLGQGVDNHNTPTLTVDQEKHLHVIYGPHGVWGHYLPSAETWATGSFKVARADAPNTLAGLENLDGPMGYRGTYASMLVTHSGHRVLVYRGGEHPPSLLFQRSGDHGGWTQARELMRQDIKPGYTHYGAQIVVDSRDTLYVGAHFFSGGDYLSLGTGLLMSRDLGATWTDARGERVPIPITYSEATAFPTPPGDDDARCSGLALDSRDRLWTLSTGQSVVHRGVILARFDADRGRWWSTDVSRYVPGERTAFQAV